MRHCGERWIPTRRGASRCHLALSENGSGGLRSFAFRADENAQSPQRVVEGVRFLFEIGVGLSQFRKSLLDSFFGGVDLRSQFFRAKLQQGGAIEFLPSRVRSHGAPSLSERNSLRGS